MITACENVCRDFGLFGEILSSLEPFVPVLAALVAACGAYLIAVRAYAQQKELDRNSRIVEEKQRVYQEYLKTIADEFGIIGGEVDQEKLRKLRFEIVRRRIEILCIGSDEVVRLVNQVSDTRSGWKTTEDIENYWNCIAELAFIMRKDCFPDTKATVDDFLVALPFSFKEQAGDIAETQ
ncbi:hypothetical protein RUA4292_03656 [Ruegeria atlantica]|uniref:DUF4760 domain-containing protein n=1 Tax=Ruegeria atlantica TaxID=81569 RepID=A0A0N7LR03_9RHOB|nr:hypothetical protein RUA4292_03656 [Ruegeria atlantica]